jgi:DNA-binding transcriptional regulator YhcF (GntR family)
MITIDKRSPIPVYKQIMLQIKKEMLFGRLSKGEQLKPVRELAETLDVNQNTVLKAYERLAMENTIYSEHGVGYFVGDADNSSIDFNEFTRIILKLKNQGMERDLIMMLVQEVWKE